MSLFATNGTNRSGSLIFLPILASALMLTACGENTAPTPAAGTKNPLTTSTPATPASVPVDDPDLENEPPSNEIDEGVKSDLRTIAVELETQYSSLDRFPLPQGKVGKITIGNNTGAVTLASGNELIAAKIFTEPDRNNPKIKVDSGYCLVIRNPAGDQSKIGIQYLSNDDGIIENPQSTCP